MRINVVYQNNKRNDEETGICVMEGRISAGRPEWLSMGLPVCRDHAKQICLTAICRTKGDISDAGALMKDFLRRLRFWFEEELPGILHHFSFRIVMCYWRRICREYLVGEELPFDVSVFLFYRDEYLFLESGDIQVYEYRYSRGKYNRWYTGRERRVFATELGESENQKIWFKVRKISEHCLFLLSPEQIQPKNPGKIRKKEKWKEFVGEQCEKASSILLMDCLP